MDYFKFPPSGAGGVNIGTIQVDTGVDVVIDAGDMILTLTSADSSVIVDGNDGTKVINLSVIASTVPLLSITGSTFSSVQDLQNWFHSAGLLSAIAFVDNGDGTIDVPASEVAIRATNTDAGDLHFATIALTSSLAMIDNDTTWVYVEYNAGAPQVIATITERIDYNTNVLLGKVFREGTSLHINNATTMQSGDHASLMVQRMWATTPFAHESGAIISETGTINFAITSGLFWEGLTNLTTATFDSDPGGAADTFSYFHRAGGGNFTEITGQSAIDDTQYDSGAGLSTLSNNNYGVHWVFTDTDDHVTVLYGRGDYTLSEAENANVPSDLPDEISVNGFVLGKIIIQKSASVFILIESAFETAFTYSAVTDHANLTNLTVPDNHTQYFLLAGRAGGQTLIGGSASGETLVFESTSDATKGSVQTKDNFLPFDDAVFAAGWTGVDIGSSSKNYNDFYSKGEFKGFRLENFNFAGLPASSAENIGRLVFETDNNRVFVDDGTSLTPIGSSGGGAGFNWVLTGISSPLDNEVDGIDTLDFDNASENEVFATIQVPDSYVPGTQIKLIGGAYFCNVSSNNVLFKCQTTLLQAGSTILGTYANIHTSTNSENTQTVSNRLEDIGDIDLTDSSGDINAVAVSAGDKIRIKLFRDNTNETTPAAAAARLLKQSLAPKFNV